MERLDRYVKIDMSDSARATLHILMTVPVVWPLRLDETTTPSNCRSEQHSGREIDLMYDWFSLVTKRPQNAEAL
jgi:hypothetical protein